MNWPALEEGEYTCVYLQCDKTLAGSWVYREAGIGDCVGWRIDRCCAEHVDSYESVIHEWHEAQSDPLWIAGGLHSALAAVSDLYDADCDWFVSVARPQRDPS